SMIRSQIFRKMKALTDESPSDFIRNYRMQGAKALLQTGSFSVKEVAWKVGFKDIPHFSRTYQETFGHPPSGVNK
ncbi:MAG: helix-turn-helix transcriptional regulator, partial [Bacteroidetes bacterium]|nr:helix-turn-helix transcriptional regulator [Bacteroidota bacterium]